MLKLMHNKVVLLGGVLLKRKEKNKREIFRIKGKGFTLVELIITIALMLSILVIAIVAFVNISNKKKQEAYEEVKEQTILAAEQYFETYQYYLENVREIGDFARVSIGHLVATDYLNKVTDPRDGKPLNDCDYVEVTIDEKNGRYDYKYVENKDDDVCDTENYLIIKESGAPDIDVEITKATRHDSGYYVSDTEVTAHVKTGGNGAIKTVKYCTSKGICKDEVTYLDSPRKGTGGYDYDYKVINGSLKDGKEGVDGNGVTTYFKVTNVANKTVIGSIGYSKDTELPTCGSNNGKDNWTNKDFTLKQYCKDNTSGCDSSKKDKNGVYFEKKITIGEGKTLTKDSVEIKDVAGHKNTCNVNVYVDKQKPTCSVKPKEKPNGDNNWYTKNVNLDVTINSNDVKTWSWKTDSGWSSGNLNYETQKPANQTDLFVSEEGKDRKVTVTVVDQAGNEGACSTSFKIDKTAPSCKVTATGTEGKTDPNGVLWYRSKVVLKGSCSDGTSGCVSSSITNTLDKEGRYSNTLAGTIKDKAGNTSSCNYGTTIGIDWTPPVLRNATVSCDVTEHGNNTKQNRIVITVDDNLSGLQRAPFTYAHSVSACGTNGSGEYVSSQTAGANKFWHGYGCSSSKNDVVTIKKITVYDYAGNIKEYSGNPISCSYSNGGRNSSGSCPSGNPEGACTLNLR